MRLPEEQHVGGEKKRVGGNGLRLGSSGEFFQRGASFSQSRLGLAVSLSSGRMATMAMGTMRCDATAATTRRLVEREAGALID